MQKSRNFWRANVGLGHHEGLLAVGHNDVLERVASRGLSQEARLVFRIFSGLEFEFLGYQYFFIF